ncbi:MAG: 3-phosphoserine/phosphohydroxythreonine transaminase [Gammaproteobacteria bacterium]|nr:MAG: 3-phosphoserine/phosphohydroxythreonine transaminase [Gammaproteobacteria bacterium]
MNSTSRVYNFSAGPATLPTELLEQVRDELLDWQGMGRSVMEISHRSREFAALLEEAERNLRHLLQVPEHYKVLWVHGSASHQFAMVPMNLGGAGYADYACTGRWSDKAEREAERYVEVNRMAVRQESDGMVEISTTGSWPISEKAGYLYYTPNETIDGLSIDEPLDTKALYGSDVPLVADMSSCLLSRPIDIEKFGVIFAGAQKNIGTAGVTLVIIREDLVAEAPRFVPTLLQYKTYADHSSLYNTPAVFPIYIAAMMFRWLIKQGGLAAVAKQNQHKARQLYQTIDDSSLYRNNVSPKNRSWMNIPFTLTKPHLDELFLSMAEARGLVALKGHRSVGGMRASLYNAMPLSGVEALIDFMCEFEQRYAEGVDEL